jgi:hypothetical protein
MPTYGLIVSPTTTTCQQCGKNQEPGIIGLHLSKPPEPLCNTCFIDKEPRLGAILLLRPLARKIASVREPGGAAEMERDLYLQTYHRVCELVAQQTSSASVLEELQEVVERMEKLHGKLDT